MTTRLCSGTSHGRDSTPYRAWKRIYLVRTGRNFGRFLCPVGTSNHATGALTCGLAAGLARSGPCTRAPRNGAAAEPIQPPTTVRGPGEGSILAPVRRFEPMLAGNGWPTTRFGLCRRADLAGLWLRPCRRSDGESEGVNVLVVGADIDDPIGEGRGRRDETAGGAVPQECTGRRIQGVNLGVPRSHVDDAVRD